MCCFSKVPGLFIGWTVDSFHNVVRDLEIKKKKLVEELAEQREMCSLRMKVVRGKKRKEKVE